MVVAPQIGQAIVSVSLRGASVSAGLVVPAGAARSRVSSSAAGRRPE